MHPGESAPRDGQVAGASGSDREDHGVEFGPQSGDIRIDPRLGAGAEHRALGAHLRETPVDERLVHLERRDAVPQQAAEPVGTFEDGHGMSGAGELLGRGETRRAGADDGDGSAGAADRGAGRHAAVGPRPVGDRPFDPFDRHTGGVVVPGQHAGGFTRGRAQPAGELGEVVGGVQSVGGLGPPVAAHQVVPFGDQVAERAARSGAVAERESAVHAAGGLFPDRAELLVGGLRAVHLCPVADAFGGGPARRLAAVVTQESAGVRHRRLRPGWAVRGRSRGSGSDPRAPPR